MNPTEEIETSFGYGPAHRPVEQTITEGRRLVVRRRLATGAGATAVALAIGATAWTAAPLGDTDANPDRGMVASQPGMSSAGSGKPKPADAGGPADVNFPQPIGKYDEAAYRDSQGMLHVAPGWTVTERIDEPTGHGSLAIEVSKDSRRQWFHWQDDQGGAYAYAPNADAVDDADNLAAFVASSLGPARGKQCVTDGTCTENEARGKGDGNR